VAAGDIDVTSDQNINCTTPPGRPGLIDVVVETTDGQTDTLFSGYRYNEPPKLRYVIPVAGPSGLTVSVIGRNLDDSLPSGPEVDFGGVPSLLPQVVSDSLVFATVPIGNPNGPVDVSIANGSGVDTLLDGFTYILGVNAPQAATVADADRVLEAGYALVEAILVAWRAGAGPLADLDPEIADEVLDVLIDASLSRPRFD
jgi:hypothetical protein